MNKILLGFLIVISLNSHGQKHQTVVTDDIQNFWKAYDQMLLTADSLKQIETIQTQYIDQGTAGLTGIVSARRYTAAEYVQVISQYPAFWKSVRKTL